MGGIIVGKYKIKVVILFLIISCIILYVYANYYFVPKWGIIQQQKIVLNEKKSYLEKLQLNYAKLSELQYEVNELNIQNIELDKKISEEVKKPEITKYLYTLSKNNGIVPEDLSFEPIQENEGSYSLGMNLNFTGSIANIFKFVNLLQKDTKYQIVLDTINLNKTDALVSANVRIVAYVYKKIVVVENEGIENPEVENN